MQSYETSFGEKNSIVLLFSRGSNFVHECSANFRLLLPIFYGFSSKLAGIGKFSLKIMIFYHFGYFSTFLVQNFVRGGTFNFRTILTDFHGYTLNMTSYHVTEGINGYFNNWNLKSIHKPIYMPNLVWKNSEWKLVFYGGQKAPPPA